MVSKTFKPVHIGKLFFMLIIKFLQQGNKLFELEAFEFVSYNFNPVSSS